MTLQATPIVDKAAWEAAREEAFEVMTDDGSQVYCSLSLAKITALVANPCKEEPFSLIFLGQVDKPLLQGSYLVRSRSFEAQPIFIVPVAPVDGIPRYEAIFN